MPGCAWKTYIAYFRDPIARAQPNNAHKAISEIENIVRDFHHTRESSLEEFAIITQNVDALHQRAGSKCVFELHGPVYKHICSRNKHHQPSININCRDECDIRAKDHFFDLSTGVYPTCEHEDCNSYLRPKATLYGEPISVEEYSLAERVVLDTRKGDLVFIVGASGKVEPAASLPFRSSKHAQIIEINPHQSELTQRVFSRSNGNSFSMSAGEFFPALLEELKHCIASIQGSRSDVASRKKGD